MNAQQEIKIDLSNLYAIADGDQTFVAALLGKMCKALPLAFQNMETQAAAHDWAGLRATAHKAKSSFANLNLEEMRQRLGEIESQAVEHVAWDKMRRMVAEALTLGHRILTALQSELSKLTS